MKEKKCEHRERKFVNQVYHQEGLVLWLEYMLMLIRSSRLYAFAGVGINLVFKD